MERWLIAILVVVALVVTGILLTTGKRAEIASGPPEPEPELAPPTPSSLPPTSQLDFGDAPEYDPSNPATQVLYRGFGVEPRFPTIKNPETDDWFVSHSQPLAEIFLGEVTSSEAGALVVDRDDDDGLLTQRLAPCKTQGVELLITIPTTATPGTPLYLNALFDWSQNGSWAGSLSADRCGGLEVPEWGIRNLRLDQAPYNLKDPGIYRVVVAVTSGGGGNIWSRFTVTTVSVPLSATGEWNGQGQFGPGESEDWILFVLETERGLGVPQGVPSPPVISPPTPGPPSVTPPGPPSEKKSPPLPKDEIEKKSKEIQKGNNGVGNGIDPQPPGNPPCNDCVGTGPGNPGNKGGPQDKGGDQDKQQDQQQEQQQDKSKDKDKDKDSGGNGDAGGDDKGKDKDKGKGK